MTGKRENYEEQGKEEQGFRELKQSNTAVLANVRVSFPPFARLDANG
jgi:hypothetical protein